MRKLASIQRITELTPIEGKDRIVLASVLGWRVIVNKEDYQPGDLCVYIEVDSQLPEKPEFEFLKKCNYRIKTMKMAGVISQGICFPLSILPERSTPYEEDEDVTSLLGVVKYDPYLQEEPQPVQPKKKSWLMRFKWYRKFFAKHRSNKGGFPDFISKTDETRIQSAPWYLNDNRNSYVATEKVDGTSGTWALKRHKRFLLPDRFEFIVCSRNMRLQKDASIYWQVAEKYNIETVLHNLIGRSDFVAIQGECIGPKIQGNKYRVASPHMYVFNVIYPSGRMGSVQARNLIGTRGLNFVPIVNAHYYLPQTVEEVLKYAHGQSALADTLREGLVVRSQDGKQSFKAVDPEFLLKYHE